DQAAGRNVKCPHCGRPNRVPAPTSSATPNPVVAPDSPKTSRPVAAVAELLAPTTTKSNANVPTPTRAPPRFWPWLAGTVVAIILLGAAVVIALEMTPEQITSSSTRILLAL